MKETAKHREAFDIYLAMGQKRSLAAIGRHMGVTKQAAEKWSSAFKWQDRLEEREDAIATEVSKKVDRGIATMIARQIRTAQTVQEIFQKRLAGAVGKNGKLLAKGYKPTGTDAARWAEIERELRQGEPLEPGDKDAPAFVVEEQDVEKIERIIIERVNRVRRFRKEVAGKERIRTGGRKPRRIPVRRRIPRRKKLDLETGR